MSHVQIRQMPLTSQRFAGSWVLKRNDFFVCLFWAFII